MWHVLQVPRLTPEQLAAIKLFEELAASDEHAIHYILEPGDIQLLNNHTCLHHRTAFEDYEVRHCTMHRLQVVSAPRYLHMYTPAGV
jgi:alpha-ketoglutarate-dependent taurine dioxygenase